jgi:hypothetical protein
VSDASSVEMLLKQAGEREKVYDWLGAGKVYEKALSSMPESDCLKMGRIKERIGYDFYRAAMQAENRSEFVEKISLAIANHKKAKEIYVEMSDSSKTPKALRCDAMIALLNSWFPAEALIQRRFINECWKLTKEALTAFREAGDNFEIGITFNQLINSAGRSITYEEDFQIRQKVVKEAIEYGEHAIKSLATLGNPRELAKAFVNTASSLVLFGYFFQDLDGREKSFQKARDYWEKAIELSEEAAFLEFSSGLGVLSLDWGVGTEKTMKNLGKALEYARKTGDRLRIGCALEYLSMHAFWMFNENPEEVNRLLRKALEYAEEAKSQYSSISFVSPLGDLLWVEAPYAEYYWIQVGGETDLKKRRELLEKAVESMPDLLSKAEKSGCPQNIQYAHHVASKIITSQAMMEPDIEEKKGLLEKSLEHRNEAIKYVEQTLPFDYWNRGVMQWYSANTKYELANLARDKEHKGRMLEDAIANAENALNLMAKELGFWEKEGISPKTSIAVAEWQYRYANLLERLYEVTRNRECLTKAVQAFEYAAETVRRLDAVSLLAETYWRIAQVYDTLGEHLKSAEHFSFALINYKAAAEKIPQLRDFYNDLSLYMQAWSEIEKARHNHIKQEYGIAKQHFEEAASLYNSMKQRRYLAPNYAAWSQVEHAEELSRKEQCEEAMQTFEQASELFKKTRESIQEEISKIGDEHEKQMATNMLKATSIRLQYCVARAALEEAKILDKKGDHYASSEKYGSTAEMLEEIIKKLESDQEQAEIKLILKLSRAWQKMTLAEAESSPALYAEASQLFEEAKDLSQNEKTKMLLLGHSRFCKALDAGTRFADTRDTTMHADADRYLESASSYYAKAGFPKASEYAEATELLFDAYEQMDKAQEEKDPQKKANLYTMAETMLQTSAGSFMKAEHPEKREQVLGLLENVKKKLEFTRSLAEMMHVPTIVSSTASFTLPTPNSEQAVGSERFESADIQANIITSQKEIKIGENLELELELVNAGKGLALLIKVNEIIPKGFDLVEKPENLRVEDSYINMKGKRLQPLKPEEVRLVLKPKTQGTFTLKPTILYLDENGKYKSHEPEPVTITVKELGIKGWIKGER